MQDEVLEGDQLAGEPEAGAGVLKMRPADETFANRARPDALVEAGERVFGGGERIFERIQGAPVRDFIQRFSKFHASSAATSIATPGTRAGASIPPTFRSRNS